MKQISKTSKFWAGLVEFMDSAPTDAQVLAKAVEFTASRQDKGAPAEEQAALLDALVEISKFSSSMPTLGITIRMDQHRKIERFGSRAFCLSDKQLAVVCREIADANRTRLSVQRYEAEEAARLAQQQAATQAPAPAEATVDIVIEVPVAEIVRNEEGRVVAPFGDFDQTRIEDEADALYPGGPYVDYAGRSRRARVGYQVAVSRAPEFRRLARERGYPIDEREG